jgi:hypothetical protein
MAQTPLKTQKWKAVAGQIVKLPGQPDGPGKTSLALKAGDLNLDSARIVWEAENQEPVFGKTFTFSPAKSPPQWLEAEAQLPDGRRIFAVANPGSIR